MAVNYQPEVMVQAMQQVEEEFKVKITFSIEDEPLGTGAFPTIIVFIDDVSFAESKPNLMC